MARDEDEIEAEEARGPLYRGKTYGEWVRDIMEAAGYDPMDFVGKDEAGLQTVFERYRSMHVALMEIAAIFGDKTARAQVYKLYTNKFVEKAKLTLQAPGAGGRMNRASLTTSPGAAQDLMERLLNGSSKLPPMPVTEKQIQVEKDRFKIMKEVRDAIRND